MRGIRLDDKKESPILDFDVNVKLEEKERKSGRMVAGFVMTVGTKPSVVRFEVEGITTLEGKNPEIDRLLEVDPKTKIPLLLHRIYQHVFTSTFLLATILGTSYPPPDLFFSSKVDKQGSEEPVEWKEKIGEKPEKKKPVKPKGRTRRRK